MAGKLRKCIDCGADLSTTAKECGGCKSTDPFGRKRAEEKAKMVGLLCLAALLVIGGALIHFHIIDVKSFFK